MVLTKVELQIWSRNYFGEKINKTLDFLRWMKLSLKNVVIRKADS